MAPDMLPGKTLVTGASGFVGRALCRSLAGKGVDLIRTSRSFPPDCAGAGWYSLELEADKDWTMPLAGVETVFHLAARVHVMRAPAMGDESAYRNVNVEATEHLARSAAAAGVKRFVFLSSIKVNGESTFGTPFTAADAPDHRDFYAMSKWEAEQALLKVSRETGMEVVILRAPLVYGEGVKANFLKLLVWVDQGMPLPLKSVRNRRSMIYLGNLVDALMLAGCHAHAAGRVWLVSDGEDVSTPELISLIAQAMHKRDRLWRVPPAWLRAVGLITGKSSEVQRLLGSLQLDSTPMRQELGWIPPYSMEQGLAETVRWYRSTREV